MGGPLQLTRRAELRGHRAHDERHDLQDFTGGFTRLRTGHAGGHFDFDLVERAMGEGIAPDVISSDLHGRLSQPGFGVVGDLPTVLTKFVPMGLSFDEIIAKCTVDAARVIGWQDRIGSLEVGREADIAVLQILDDPVTLRDSVGGEKLHKQRIAAKWTVRAGEVFQGRG